MPLAKTVLRKWPLPSPKKIKASALGLSGSRRFLGPFGHLGGEDVEIAIAVDVGDLQGVAVDHVAAQQVMADPVECLLRIALALIPLERPDAVARCDDDLRGFRAFDEPIRGDAAADGADADRLELIVAEVFEPVVAGQQIDLAVAVDVARGDAFGIFARDSRRRCREKLPLPATALTCVDWPGYRR